MKTLEQINANIAAIETNLRHKVRTESAHKVREYGERLALLRTCKLYLETGPTSEAVQRQYEAVQRAMNEAEANYEGWCAKKGLRPDMPSTKSTYAKVVRTPTLKAQLAILGFLLDKG